MSVPNQPLNPSPNPVPVPALDLSAPVVVIRSHTTDSPTEQEKTIRSGRGVYSHDEELPLKVRVKREGWFGRRISVTTMEPVSYQDAYTTIRVKAGFTFDLASVPRPLWLFVSPFDIALESCFHDVGYREQKVRRRTVDQTLLSMMEDRGVPWWIRWSVYLGVRIGGWKAWNANAAKSKAEKAADMVAVQVEAAAVTAAEAIVAVEQAHALVKAADLAAAAVESVTTATAQPKENE